MTIAPDLQAMWGNFPKGSISRLIDGLDYIQSQIFQEAYYPTKSAATTISAKTIDNYLPVMEERINQWKIASTRRSEIDQEEVVVLMPPKKQYSIELDVNYLGRAKPFISIDETDLEIIGD